jgi:hypothetical protein
MPPIGLNSLLLATRGDQAEMIFDWSVTPDASRLRIVVRFGEADRPVHEAVAYVPWKSNQKVKIQGNAPTTSVNGDVAVWWGADDSYVVRFEGYMVRPDYIRMYGIVIVFAYLSHTTAEADASE